MTVAKVLVEVVGAACAALCMGIWPNADFEVVVFIMISLILILFALAIQIYKTMT
jgi:sulfite exporter TauE/SafE